MNTKMDFIDLKTQYQLIKEKIHQRMFNVLEHGQYIMGEEIFELEK
jgi:UDP-2-acetamido-2-deoxy-ribo-hexuluronate aminotransferase